MCLDGVAVRGVLAEVGEGGSVKKTEVCVWVADGRECYDTGCDEKFVFIEGTPAENKMRFCGYCGRRLKVGRPAKGA